MKKKILLQLLTIRFFVSHMDSASPVVLLLACVKSSGRLTATDLLEGKTNISCDMAEIPRLSSTGSRFLLVPVLLARRERRSFRSRPLLPQHQREGQP